MKRIRFRKFRRSGRRPWRRSTKIKLVVAGIVVLAIFLFVSLRLRPMIQTVTATIAKQVSTQAIQSTVIRQLEEGNWTYEDFASTGL